AGRNAKAYKLSGHQHEPEMARILGMEAEKEVKLFFTPHLIPIMRGISATLYIPLKSGHGLDDAAVSEIYKTRYKNEPFVKVSESGKVPEIENVANTNYCNIGFAMTDNYLKVVSCIDNLLKGAAGQAVQNMNIMCGFDETEGLL
ncbi:Asd/ArgC dimerization domain-containing protein, partial [Candidatus Omnitrophota bacterium]